MENVPLSSSERLYSEILKWDDVESFAVFSEPVE
jgi:hypothetical protein